MSQMLFITKYKTRSKVCTNYQSQDIMMYWNGYVVFKCLALEWRHMSIMASEISGKSIFRLEACSVWQQRKYQRSAFLAFREGSLLATVIMTSDDSRAIKSSAQSQGGGWNRNTNTRINTHVVTRYLDISSVGFNDVIWRTKYTKSFIARVTWKRAMLTW